MALKVASVSAAGAKRRVPTADVAAVHRGGPQRSPLGPATGRHALRRLGAVWRGGTACALQGLSRFIPKTGATPHSSSSFPRHPITRDLAARSGASAAGHILPIVDPGASGARMAFRPSAGRARPVPRPAIEPPREESRAGRHPHGSCSSDSRLSRVGCICRACANADVWPTSRRMAVDAERCPPPPPTGRRL